MSIPQDWETMAEKDSQAYVKRVELTRTMQNWLARSIKVEPMGLVSCCWRRPRSPRLPDEELRTRILALEWENQSRLRILAYRSSWSPAPGGRLPF